MEFKVWFILFIIYSFMGWLMEVISVYIQDKKFVNRGFLIGPYCPIYGIGALLIIFLLNDYMDRPLSLFLQIIFVCSILEYTTSYILEKMFKIRWWDYSKRKYNINGRICLETMIPFAIVGWLLLYFVNPFITNIILGMSSIWLNVVFYILLSIFGMDVIISCEVVSNVQIITSSMVKDSTEEVNKKVKFILTSRINKMKKEREKLESRIREKLQEQGFFTRRFINAFPRFEIKLRRKEEKSNGRKTS